MLCFGHVAAHFLSKRFYILDTCIIFHEIMFFKELLAFRALYFIQGAFILFRALLFYSGRFYFIQGALFFLQSAFPFLHSAFLILHSAFLKFSVWVSTSVFLYLWVSALFYFSDAAIISIPQYEALTSWLMSEIFYDIMCISSNINFVQNF